MMLPPNETWFCGCVVVPSKPREPSSVTLRQACAHTRATSARATARRSASARAIAVVACGDRRVLRRARARSPRRTRASRPAAEWAAPDAACPERRYAASRQARAAPLATRGACTVEARPQPVWLFCRDLQLFSVTSFYQACAASRLRRDVLSSWPRCLRPGAIVRIATYSTGMNMMERNVDASMPPATVVPTELRAPEPAPVAIRQRHHAEDERERRHENRPQPDARGLDRRVDDRHGPAARRCSANSTIRIEFLAARPTSMTSPI